MYQESNKKVKNWEKFMFADLDADEVEADFKKFSSAAVRLRGRLDNMKLNRPRDVA